jgi:hypothetical protein
LLKFLWRTCWLFRRGCLGGSHNFRTLPWSLLKIIEEWYTAMGTGRQ